MGKILFLANHYITIYAFRKELVERLLEEGHDVILAFPNSDSENDYFSKIGCKIIDTPMNRRGTNPFSDLKLMYNYIKIINDIKPDIILTYTIKPNIYGGIASKFSRSKIIHTVTGLGSVYIQDIWLKNLIALLNKFAFAKAEKIFFLNKENMNFYNEMGIIKSDIDTKIVPGSGVNLKKFKYSKPENNNEIVFTFIGRILKDKGIEEFLEAAKNTSEIYDNVKFKVVGFVEEQKYINLLHEYQEKGIIEYLGQRDDIPKIMSESSSIVLPSYGEGRGTVLQEGAAAGRPLITCDTYGCRENVEEGYNGFLCEVRDVKSLQKAFEKIIDLSYEKRVLMGERSRKKAEKEFDREIVINSYIREINDVL